MLFADLGRLDAEAWLEARLAHDNNR